MIGVGTISIPILDVVALLANINTDVAYANTETNGDNMLNFDDIMTDGRLIIQKADRPLEDWMTYTLSHFEACQSIQERKTTDDAKIRRFGN